MLIYFGSFGFLDGISNPSIIGFDNLTKPPGPEAVNPGILLTGHQDDLLQAQRASWATDGSFLVFRYLFQNVPEFHDYLKKNPIVMDGATPEQGSELLGARIVGRWMSGMFSQIRDPGMVINSLTQVPPLMFRPCRMTLFLRRMLKGNLFWAGVLNSLLKLSSITGIITSPLLAKSTLKLDAPLRHT